MKSKKTFRRIVWIAAAVSAVSALTVGCSVYARQYKITDIDSSVSNDGRHEVIFQSVGEPDWPFGSSHAKIILKEENDTVIQYKLDVSNDGGTLSPENWDVKWQEGSVQVVISGEEQNDTLYTLYFDGTSAVRLADEAEYGDLISLQKEQILNLRAEGAVLNTDVLQPRENELTFSFSIDDFTEAYNGRYWTDHKKRYILPTSFDNWQVQTFGTGIHSPYRTKLFDYSENRQMLSLPTISFYVPEQGGFVEEVALVYDWHSNTVELYERYEEMCDYAVKTMFPDLSDEQAEALYKKVNEEGYDHAFSMDEWYGNGSEPVPFSLYYSSGIGMYSHFAVGSRQRLCFIPVTEQTLEEFRQKGTKVYEVK